MLESLHIRNLALISSLDLDFTDGLNVITGETGAGKSLVISAIKLLSGGRAAPSSIRKGETACEASGVFYLGNCSQRLRDTIADKLEEMAIPQEEDGRLLIRRVINEKSGSRAFINATPVTAAFLKEIGQLLIDIHGPHDNQSLLQNSHQLALLDIFANALPLVKKCREIHQQATEVSRKLKELANDGLTPEDAELLKHQLREITDADLQPGEDEELVKKFKLAENSKRLLELALNVSQGLTDSDNSVIDQLSSFLRLINEIESLDPDSGNKFSEPLLEAFDQIQSLSGQLSDYAQNLDLDPETFQTIEERLELVQKLKRKYGPSLDDVFAAQNRIRERLNNILNRGNLLADLQKQSVALQKQLSDACRELTAVRCQAAEPLAAAITEKLRKLGFNKATFRIALSSTAPGANGADVIDFQFAPNLGEDLQSLKDTASSGETARVMLAVKTVLSEADDVPVLVFDEIDANVGGRVAIAVASELRAVASRHQVFSISHLAQIAAAAQNHYLVEKSVHEERTFSSMKALDTNGRVNELIRMLGASANSTAAVSHARELIQQAQSL